MSESYVVIRNPKDARKVGALVDRANAAVILSKGGATLPVDAEMRKAGMGFTQVFWGDGWPLDAKAPTKVAPFMLYARALTPRMNWAAFLVPDADVEKKALAGANFTSGSLTVTSTFVGSLPRVAMAPEHRPVTSGDLGTLRPEVGGWLVGGKCMLSLVGDGLCAFSLYGSMPGVRVAWVAASVTER